MSIVRRYTIRLQNGDRYDAATMREALAIARRVLGVPRIYRGGEYQTDRPAGDGEREDCMEVDIWTTRTGAMGPDSAYAPLFISYANNHAKWQRGGVTQKNPSNS